VKHKVTQTTSGETPSLECITERPIQINANYNSQVAQMVNIPV